MPSHLLQIRKHLTWNIRNQIHPSIAFCDHHQTDFYAESDNKSANELALDIEVDAAFRTSIEVCTEPSNSNYSTHESPSAAIRPKNVYICCYPPESEGLVSARLSLSMYNIPCGSLRTERRLCCRIFRHEREISEQDSRSR